MPDLLGSYWTTAGPVEIHVGREWSLFDWADRCAEAARAGLSGLGLWHADLEHQLEVRDLAEIRRILDDHGLVHLEVEFLNDWFLPEGSEARNKSDRTRRLLFDAAAALGASHIKVGNIPGNPCEPGRLTERFGELCAEAANHHDAPILYELMPFDGNVPSLAAAVELVVGAGAANGGLVLDTWHLGKLGITPEELRGIPRDFPSYVELSDGTKANMPDFTEETTQHRRLPGEGEFDLPGYVAVLRDHGYDGPWGVEVLSESLRALPLAEAVRRTVDTASAQFRDSEEAR